MRRFAALLRELDETTRTRGKTVCLAAYFRDVPAADAAWAIRLLCGPRPRRSVTLAELKNWCAEMSGIPEWLFAECSAAVGDLSETLALLLPVAAEVSGQSLQYWMEHRVLPLSKLSEPDRKQAVMAAWKELDQQQRFVFNRLLTGGLRPAVSEPLVIRALAEASGVPASVIAHRLTGLREPSVESWRELIRPESGNPEIGRPYPFCPARPLTGQSAESSACQERFGPVSNWLVEWKWPGLRTQLIRRQQQLWLWQRDEELLAGQFPELLDSAMTLPEGTVLDGEMVLWRDGEPAPLAELQKRIGTGTRGRGTASRKRQREAPVRFVAFDLLEDRGVDIRGLPLGERRLRLESLIGNGHDAQGSPDTAHRPAADHQPSIVVSPPVDPVSWDECRERWLSSRSQQVDGLMLKRRDGDYRAGQRTGQPDACWWSWQADPYSCAAVLMYAKRGEGLLAGQHPELTFGVWREEQLVPVARVSAGLTEQELRQVDRFVQQNTVERFGPVRQVSVGLVCELTFAGLQPSGRHKSGISLYLPRIVRLLADRNPETADRVESVLERSRRSGGTANC